MPSIKKMLFISCSAGMGHDRAAEALYLTCQQQYPQIQCQRLNISDHLAPLAKKIFISSYNKLVNKRPSLYGLIFKITNNQLWAKLAYLLSFIFYPLTKQINQQITNYQPDIIVSTHFYAAFILSKKTKTPLYTIITDYYKAHNIWLAPRTSKFFVATPEIKKTLDKMGLKNAVTGIPIHPDFYQIEPALAPLELRPALPELRPGERGEDKKIKDKWGLDSDSQTILFMPTIKGKIDVGKTIKTLLVEMKKINLIVISGKNNQTLFEKLSAIKNMASNSQNLLFLRPTNQIDELMKIADVIITKAGGLTLSECLYLQKPTIIINSIPGQEEYNADYFITQGWATRARNNQELIIKIKETLNNVSSVYLPLQTNSNNTILKYILEPLGFFPNTPLPPSEGGI